jgi:hypothetical protein
MKPTVPSIAVFTIEFRGKIYSCGRITKNNTLLYRVAFPESYLYLTKAVTPDGTTFWTSIPEDIKLKHVVKELGEIIDKVAMEPGEGARVKQADLFN